MNKRNLKVVKLYTISVLCIIIYFYLENSDLITEIVKKSERSRYGSFPTFFLSGLFKYGLLSIGIGIILFLSYFLIKQKLGQSSKQEQKLTLLVSYDFGQVEKIISKKVTTEIIRNTMNSINWNEFHIVQLKDNHNNTLHVSGNLKEDGLASGFITENKHILFQKPIKTVDQMTEILIDYLKGKDIWRNKYEYK